jgi:hypothetical protein
MSSSAIEKRLKFQILKSFHISFFKNVLNVDSLLNMSEFMFYQLEEKKFFLAFTIMLPHWRI